MTINIVFLLLVLVTVTSLSAFVGVLIKDLRAVARGIPEGQIPDEVSAAPATAAGVTAVLAVIIFLALCYTAKADDLIIVEELPLGFTCDTVSLPNGERTRCKYVADEAAGCPIGQTRICIRAYGSRSCACYPE